MALVLPRIVVDLTGPAPRARGQHGALLRPGELTWLLGFDQDRGVRAGSGTVDRCVALGGRRWAVGRRHAGHVIWRLLDEDAVRRLGHPAWLWTRDWWFDPTLPDDRPGPTPPALPLRTVLQAAAPLAESRRRLIKTLAATVAALRRRQLGERPQPVAVVVPTAVVTSASAPARSFALALLTCLPPDLRDAARVAVGELAPDPERLDLVVCDAAPAGFQLVDAADPPGEGDDLVAYYIRNRLHAGDSEAVEAAAFLSSDAPDGWGEAVAALLRQGGPGLSDFGDEALARDPEGTVRAIAARLRAGATVDERLLDILVKVTLRTRDPRPWLALVGRPAVVRARAVQALLARSSDLEPKGPLIKALGALYPPGAEIGPWLEALLGWVQAGHPQAVEVLQHTLLDWPASRTRATRASLWSEVVRTLVRLRRYDAAMDAVVSPLSRELAREGAGRAVASNWGAIPAEVRSPEKLAELVDLLAEAADAGPAVAMLFRYIRDSQAEVLALVTRWTALARADDPDDPVLELVRSSDYLADWVRDAVQRGAPEEAELLVSRLARGPEDPVWEVAAEALFDPDADDPRGQLLAMRPLGSAVARLAGRSHELLGLTLSSARYPDPELTELARELAEVPGRSQVWPWIAISAAPTGRFDDATVDATVAAFCEAPPASVAEQELALVSARALGEADGAEPIDHARWIVRLCLAPDDGTAFQIALATAMVQGLATQPEAAVRMAAITNLLLDLEADHPALLTFVTYLLPNAWLGGLPRMYIQAVETERLHDSIATTWRDLVGA